MKNVNRVVKGGKVHLYLRKAGFPAVKLKSPEPDVFEGSALQKEVLALIGTGGKKAAPGTLSAACDVYELGADFMPLADSTKYIYRLFLKELTADFGALPLTAFTPAYIRSMRDVWAKRGHRAANQRLQILKNVLGPSIDDGLFGEGVDPMARIKNVRRPHDAADVHIIWPEGVVETVIEAAIERQLHGLARAVAIARYVGPRRSDLVKLTKSARRDGRFRFLSGKKKVQVDQLEDAALTRWLAKIPAHPSSLVMVYNTSPGGGAYTDDALGKELAALVVELHKAEKIDSDQYALHGLRHTRGVEAALAGVSDAEGAALLGHGSPHSFAIYRKQADRIRLSENAMAKIHQLRERTSNEDLQTEVQTTCKPSEGSAT